MSFADKKGIVVASGFKLQAEALLDARQSVDTIAERDELVTLHAAPAGLMVYVKENKTTYTYTGTEWQEFSKGTAYVHPATHPATMITQDATHKFVTDTNIAAWNAKADKSAMDTALAGKVDKTTTVNGKALTGNITLAAADVSAIPTTAKGAANGVATLDATGKVPSSQLPAFVDDVINGYLSGGKFYKEEAHTTVLPNEDGKIYIDLHTEKTYRWSGTAYVVISETIALGETSATAYRGDRGKIAYDHSQVAHAPANAEQNVQSDWSVTDSTSDAFIKNKPTSLPTANAIVVKLNGGTTEGTNMFTFNGTAAKSINITPAAIGAAATSHTHTKAQITDFPTSLKNPTALTFTGGVTGTYDGSTAKTVNIPTTLPANGGNADTVGGHTVGINVPADAKFTDTVFVHPNTAGNLHVPTGGATGQVLQYGGSSGKASWASADFTSKQANFTTSFPDWAGLIKGATISMLKSNFNVVTMTDCINISSGGLEEPTSIFIDIPDANSSTAGLLSIADWTRFNKIASDNPTPIIFADKLPATAPAGAICMVTRA